MLKATDRAHAAIADALSWTGEPFDIVFVDPPFAREWVLPSLDHLVASNLLTHHGTDLCGDTSRLRARGPTAAIEDLP